MTLTARALRHASATRATSTMRKVGFVGDSKTHSFAGRSTTSFAPLVCLCLRGALEAVGGRLHDGRGERRVPAFGDASVHGNGREPLRSLRHDRPCTESLRFR